MGIPKVLLISLCWWAMASTSKAQSTYIPLGNDAYHTIDRVEIKGSLVSNDLHTSTKPYNRLNAVIHTESVDDMEGVYFKGIDRYNHHYVYKDNSEWSMFGAIKSKKTLGKQLYKYQSDFLFLKDFDDFWIKGNPVFQFQLGKEFGVDGLQYINSKGAEIRGMVSEKLGFYSLITDNQMSLYQQVYENYARQGVLPGAARYKSFISSVGDDLFVYGVDYYTAKGYVTFQPIERIRMQFGHDKNFIGNGIRSLFLSDFGADYLFLKINSQFWKLQYQNLFMELTEQFDGFPEGLLPRKYAAMHHLSINVTKWLNLGAFESVVFDRQQGYDLQYLNPIIFYRWVEHQLGSPDNVLIGFDFKANFLQHFSCYGQLLLDEFSFGHLMDNDGWWANKYGWQLGLKYIDVFNVSNLDLQLELNRVQPYTYSHYTTGSNYSHYNQALAHPLGANFKEALAKVYYRPHQQITVRLQAMYAQYGADADTSYNWGQNILTLNTSHEQDFDNTVAQGELTTVTMAKATLTYMPKHNLFFDLTGTYRKSISAVSKWDNTTQFVALGMRLNLTTKDYLF